MVLKKNAQYIQVDVTSMGALVTDKTNLTFSESDSSDDCYDEMEVVFHPLTLIFYTINIFVDTNTYLLLIQIHIFEVGINSVGTSAGNLFKFCCRASTEYQVAVSD